MAADLLTERTWTKPYYGVSHRYVNGRQCTVSTYSETMTTATVFGRRGSGCVFSDAVAAPHSFTAADEAREWCERTARL